MAPFRGQDEKEGVGMAPQSSDATRLLIEAARAGTLIEQQRLMGEAMHVQGAVNGQAAREREVDLAHAVVNDRLTPVPVHEHHTAATDWLGDVDTTPTGNPEREMIAQGSVWYAQVHEAVKQHPDELSEQARGMARRLAGRYGRGADAAERSFLDHVAALHGRDVAQGLVVAAAAEQTTEGPGVQGGQVTMGLPGDMTSSERAPAMQDLENNTAGGSVSDREWPTPLELPQQDVDAANGDSGTSRVAVKAPYFSEDAGTGVAERERAAEKSSDDDDNDERDYRDHPDWQRHHNAKGSSMPQYTAACPECRGCPACGGTHRVAVRAPRTAASGLDQIDQTVDPHDNPKATPYPTDVAFPWEQPGDSSQAIQETEQQLAEREQRKGASRQQRAEAAARYAATQIYHRVLAGQDDSGWAGDMGAGGVRPGMQDTGNPGVPYPGNLADADPVYGQGGDNGNQPLKPYGADEANDITNNPGMGYQPGQPAQYDEAGRPNQVGQPTARRVWAKKCTTCDGSGKGAPQSGGGNCRDCKGSGVEQDRHQSNASFRPSDNDPEIARALTYVRQRRAILDRQS
jgi:hypothetical protein